MTLEDWDELNARFHTLLRKVNLVPRSTSRDCTRMARAVEDLLRQADQERVNCRRRQRVTLRFEQLITQAQEALTNFEGHVILALLLKEPE